MTTSILRRLFRFSVFGAYGIVATVAAAQPGSGALAADASTWDAGTHSSVRLIAGTASPGAAALRAGVEVKLANGWKTYWRYPGDSGVPPRFDFTRSRNVKSVTVAWPAPLRFSEGGENLIGYTGAVILPLRIVPDDPNKPVELELKLDYAICEKLCIPVDAKAALTLAGGASTFDAALAAAESRVPRPTALGEGSPAIRAVTHDGGKNVMVDVAASADVPLDLFVEGPTPDWALPVPEPAPAGNGTRRFIFALDGLPPGASADGAELRFTLVSPAHAVEVTHRLP